MVMRMRLPLSPAEVRVQIRAWDGESLDSITRELIDPAGLSDECKSALWLYAWASAKRGCAWRAGLPGDVLSARG